MTKGHENIQVKIIDISIVIVNYRSWVHLEKCLQNLKDIKQDEFTFEVIIVDNSSGDNQFANFKNEFPNFKFIENPINGGFSNGCNLGASHSIGEHFLFLNPDTLATKKPLKVMLQMAKEHPDYGVISCTKLNKKELPETESRLFLKMTRLFGSFRAIYDLTHKNELEDRFNPSKEIIFPDWVSGSVFFMSRKWFETIGGWNEDYWLYSEDVDFCKRISDAGGKIALTRATKIKHNHGGASRSSIKTSALTKVEVLISKHVYFQNHFKGFTKIFAHILFLIVHTMNKLLLGIIGTFFFFVPKLKVNLYLFLNLMEYYFGALINLTWISKRAPNYKR